MTVTTGNAGPTGSGEVSKGPRNKPRARLVCANCRQRKIKCDAEKISPGAKCSPCRSSSHPCHIDRDADRRRHGASHQKLVEMQERIRSLEGMIQPRASNDGAAPTSRVAASPGHHTTHIGQPSHRASQSQPGIPSPVVARSNSVVSASQNLHVGEQERRSVPAQEPDGGPGWQAHSPTMPMVEFDMIHVVGRDAQSHVAIPDLPTVPPESHFSPLIGNQSPPRAHDSSTKDVTMSNAGDAQPQSDHVAFYGSTTQNHVHSPLPESPHSLQLASMVNHADSDFEHETTMNMDSVQLRKALLLIFFKLQTNVQVVVHQDLFMRGRTQGGRHRYYSEFLENSILAAATRHSTSLAVRQLGTQYADRAKARISFELDQPNIASLQGFLVLSDFESTRGRARIGWTYSNIATGLLIDLALYVPGSCPTKEDEGSSGEAEFRDTLLLVTFVYATLWSLYLGRPNSVPVQVITAVRRVIGDRSCTTTLQMWVALCIQMLDIIDILNSPGALRHADRNANFRLCSLEMTLRSVFDGLPPELAFDDACIDELDAEAYSPHMQYCGLQVTLHRAMIEAGQARPSGKESNSPKSLDHLKAVVHENALRIAKLALSYRRIFGLENVVTVMLDNMYVAAVALLLHITRMRQLSRPFEHEVGWTRSLYDILKAVAKHLPVAVRMRSSLMHFVEQRSLAGIFLQNVPDTSPDSISGGAIGVTVAPDPANSSSLEHVDQAAAADRHDPSKLDFTLTAEDDWWLDDSVWNTTAFPSGS